MSRTHALWGVLCLVASLLGHGTGHGATVIVDTFENIAWGEKWVTAWLQGNADPEVRKSAEAHTGAGAAAVFVGSGRIRIQHEVGKGFIGHGDKLRLPLPGEPTSLGLWVRGNGAPVTLTAVLQDHNNKRVELTLGTVEAPKWTFLKVAIPRDAQRVWPLRLHSLTLDATEAENPGDAPVLLDDLTVETGSERAPLFLSFEQDEREAPLEPGQPIAMRARVQNIGSKTLPLRLSLEVQDRREARNPVTKKGLVVMRETRELTLAPGEAQEVPFRLRSAPAVLNAVLTADNADDETFLTEEELELRIFPDNRTATEKIREMLAQDRDFFLINSDYSPAALCRSRGPELYLFRGLPEGQVPPQWVAFAGPDGIEVRQLGGRPIRLDLAESWLLFWFGDHESMRDRELLKDPFDVPFLVSLERKPTALSRSEDGIALAFPESAGYVALMPLYGSRPQPRARTAAWETALPETAAGPARQWNAILKDYPLHCREAYKVDAAEDEVRFQQQFDFLTIHDEWGTKPIRMAPLPPLLSLVVRSGWSPLAVEPKPTGLDYLTGTGPWAGAMDSDRFTYTFSGLLRYVNRVERPPALPDTEEARRAVDALEVRHRFDRDFWTVVAAAQKGIDPLLRNYPYFTAEQQEQARRVMRVHLAYLLNPRNLWFLYRPEEGRSYVLDGINSRRMGWTDGNAWSSSHIRALGRYAFATGDVEFIRRRWETVKALYNVPVKLHTCWAVAGYNAGGGDTFDDVLNGSIHFARLAAMVGDDESYRFGAALAAKQFMALYGVLGCMPDYVKDNDMVLNLSRLDLGENGRFSIIMNDAGDRSEPIYDWEDLTFTDWRGGGTGFANWVLAGLCRHSEPEERFLYDHLRPYAVYILDTLPRKNCPEWYDAVYVSHGAIPKDLTHARTGRPLGSWRRGYGTRMRLQLEERHELRGYFLDVPPETVKRNLQTFLQNNNRRGDTLRLLLAGLPRTHASLWRLAGDEAPAPGGWVWTDHAFGERSGNIVMGVGQQPYRWPSLSWNGLRHVKTGRTLSFGQITPAPRKLAFKQSDLTVEAGLQVLASDFLAYPVIEQADALAALPLPHRAAILDHGLDRVETHLKRFAEQGALEWLVIGPFDNNAGVNFLHAKPPRVDQDLAIPVTLTFGQEKEYTARWTVRKAERHRLDFNRFYEPNRGRFVEGALNFAMIHVHAPEAREVNFALGSDDGYKIWLNDRFFAKHQIYRGAAPDQEVLLAVLDKGWNRIIVMVENRNFGCGWELYFRISDENGLPIGDLRYAARPPSSARP